jgi:hypothetical protein
MTASVGPTQIAATWLHSPSLFLSLQIVVVVAYGFHFMKTCMKCSSPFVTKVACNGQLVD